MKASGKPRGDSRNHSRRGHAPSRRSERRSDARYLISFICVALMIVCAAYAISWEIHKIRIERANASYQALYVQSAASAAPQTSAPTYTPTAAPSAEAPTTDPTATATIAPSVEAPTTVPTATATIAPSVEAPTPSVAVPATAAASGDAVAIDATLSPRATAGADTLVYALQTPPPVQQSFSELLSLNPETVGFLNAGKNISLPVVQRRNDNEYYLNHSFAGDESNAGTLFLDGSNLLIPEDDNLIIYGHNMRNGTMFHALSLFESADYVRQNPIVRFDTIYENRLYVPFAAFTATMDTGSERYLDIRQFLFEEDSFDLFVLKMEKLSTIDTGVDVRYGDKLLLLVTCEYLYDNGRFVVALRELRPGETEAQMRSLLQSTTDR